jgi:tellurite resistance protein TerC
MASRENAMNVAEKAGVAHAALSVGLWEWFALAGLFVLCVGLDMFVLNRKHEPPTLKRAALQSLLWLGVGLSVGAAIWALHGGVAGQEYITGYLMEYSLSFDNVFVWSLVISAFVLFRGYHHTLLMWGVIISIVLRIVFITVGVVAIAKAAFITILLGLFLVYTGVKLKMSDDDAEFNLQDNGVYRLLVRVLPVAKDRYGTAYVTRQEGGVKLTVFGIAIIMFGGVDLMFAVDSVPAILAVAKDIFVIIASNVMALLGLQSLYFLFDAVKNAFSKLNEGLAFILAGIGIKMLIASELFMEGVDWVLRLVRIPWQPEAYEIPTMWSLGGILSILVVCIVWSLFSREEELPVASMEEQLEVRLTIETRRVDG